MADGHGWPRRYAIAAYASDVVDGDHSRWARGISANHTRTYSRRCGYHQARHFRRHVCATRSVAHNGDERSRNRRRCRSCARAREANECSLSQCRFGQACGEARGESDLPCQLRRRRSNRSPRSQQGLGIRESQYRLHGDGVVCRGKVVHRGASP